MNCFELREFSQPLVKTERPTPRPGPGQVVVRMKAAALNYRDILVCQGVYNPRQSLPLIPCSDGVGVVEALGEGVTDWQVGERVCPTFCQDWVAGRPDRHRLRNTLGSPLDGALTELMAVNEQGLVRVPEFLDDTQAASLPCAGLTAWSALVTQAELSPGDTVLILGTGGVSMFALLFSKILCLRTIVTSSSEAKLEQARALGADVTVNYKEDPSWGKTVARQHGGVDLVVEVGGAGTLAQSLEATKIGGQISLIGVLSGVSEPLGVLPILMKNIRVQGILVGHRDGFEEMTRALDQAQVHPIIDRVFPFDQANEAFAYAASGQQFGKVCVSI